MNTFKESGRAVQIVSVSYDSTLELHEEALKSVLLQEPFKDMQVVVLSVAGKCRLGKSFLLDFFLRYLKAQGSEKWLEMSDKLTDGFSWAAGPDRVTNGIQIWSKPLVVTLPSGEKVAVLLMDTQGTDDIGGNVQQDVPIFALSALLSSALVFNVRGYGNNDLDSLRFFLDYGRLAEKSGDTITKPFQDLHFLVRDWSSPRTFGYGFKGGDDYFNHMARKMGGSELRNALQSAFSKVSCFLMPHPGFTVDSDDFEGQIADVDAKFVKYLRQLVAQVLGSQHLAIKEDNGTKVTVAEFLPIIKNYFPFFKDGKCPDPKNIYRHIKTSVKSRKSANQAQKDALIREQEENNKILIMEQEIRKLKENEKREQEKNKKETDELKEKLRQMEISQARVDIREIEVMQLNNTVALTSAKLEKLQSKLDEVAKTREKEYSQPCGNTTTTTIDNRSINTTLSVSVFGGGGGDSLRKGLENLLMPNMKQLQ